MRSIEICDIKEMDMTQLLSFLCIADAEKYPPAFEPADMNCLTAPTSYNSYFLKVCDRIETQQM